MPITRNNMKYKLEVDNKEVASFIYSMLEVYWLSESIGTLKLIRDSYGIKPIYIERDKFIYFLIKVDKNLSIGYYIQSDSMEDLILSSIDEELKISSVYAHLSSDGPPVDFLMESCLLKVINKFSENPSLYKTIPYPVELDVKKLYE